MSKLRIATWSLGQICDVVDGELLGTSLRAEPVRAVSIDTRQLKGGELFVAICGERFDGHDFLETACKAGASAVLLSKREAAIGLNVPAILVDNTLDGLRKLAHGLWLEAKQAGLHTVAVTGSNGKTTTKELLAALWGSYGKVWATPGNLNNHIGVPLTLCALPLECDHLILEMGANHIGEIESLIALAPAEERIITSIGRAHLEGFGSIAGIRKAKSEIQAKSDPFCAAILPQGEAENLQYSGFIGSTITFGVQSEADLRVLDRGSDGEFGRAQEVTFEVDSRVWTLSLPLLGVHNATNLAAALATLFHQKVEIDAAEINQALAALELPDGRFRQWTLKEIEILDDSYNANPSSMRASFESFLDWSNADGDRRRIGIFGEMFELGEDSEREHRELARWLAEKAKLDGALFFGAFADEMKAEFLEHSIDVDVASARDHEAAARWVRQHSPAYLFLKGSRGSRLELVIEALQRANS